MAASLLPLLGIAVKSVSTVGACAGIGAYARYKGMLSLETEKALDKMISGIFLPCLILEKVTPNMDPAVLFSIWPLVVMCACGVLYGLVAGSLIGAALGKAHPDAFPKYTGLLMVCAAFPNSFSVPLTMMLALGDAPALVADGRPSGPALVARVNMLFLMSYSVWVLARWSIGFPILSGALSFKDWTNKVLNPPVIACIIAAIFGLGWNEVKDSDMVTANGALFFGILAPFTTALSYAGRCSIPVLLMSLGARLAGAVAEVFAASPETGKPLLSDVAVEVAETPMPMSGYIAVLILRQVISPLLGILTSIWLLRGVLGVDDPVVLIVGMLQTAGPPMINLGVMAGLSGSGQSVVAKILLVTYLVSIATWTLWIAVFLHVL